MTAAVSSISEGLSVPGHLMPDMAGCMLPELEPKDLSQLKEAGWVRVGIVAAVLDGQSHLLMLEHMPSDKTPDGAFGPLAETAQVARYADGRIAVEGTAHTLSRAIHEELGVARPSDLGLRARRLGAWVVSSWPVGVSYEGQHAFAICPVLHIGSEARAHLLDTFKPTEEIRAITFVPLHEVHQRQPVRCGTHKWLGDIVAGGLPSTPRSEQAVVPLPEPAPLYKGTDIKLKDIAYL